MIYKCVQCDFETQNKKDLEKHLKMNTCNNKESDDLSQSFEMPFTCDQCDSKISIIKNKLNKDILIIQLPFKQDESIVVSQKENEINILKRENELLHKQIRSVTSLLRQYITKNLISNLTFISNNYIDTPILNTIKSHNKMARSKKTNISELIISCNTDTELIKLIGDYLIKEYKKDPQKQSIWTSDINHPSYIIRKISDNKNIWECDKNGAEVKKIVIEPVLKYINDKLANHMEKHSTLSEDEEFDIIKRAGEIIYAISDGTLANKINKYIAPNFTITDKYEDDLFQ